MSLQQSTVVVVGGGQAASQCCIRLRAVGHTGPLTLVSDEPMLPYCRPPLSKSWLVGDQTAEWLLYRPADFYTGYGIDTRLNQPAQHVDKDHRIVTLASGEQLPYDGLALALGSRVRKLSVPGNDLPEVCYIRGHADVQAIRSRLRTARRVVVVGGGFIGLEAAAVLVKTGRSVTLLASSAALLPRAGIGVVAAHLLQYHRARGVRRPAGRAILALLFPSGPLHCDGKREPAGGVRCQQTIVERRCRTQARAGCRPRVRSALIAGQPAQTDLREGLALQAATAANGDALSSTSIGMRPC